MTIAEAIKILSKLPDKTLALMVDCPHCGRGHQLADVKEYVVFKSVEEKHGD